MLFDLRPKERKDELFDREEELEALHRLTRSEWVVVFGRRMTGKTSLLKVFLHEADGIYVNLSGIRSIKGLVEELMKHARKLGVEVSVGPLTVTWSKLVEDIFSKLEGEVVGLDEAQNLPVNYMLKLLKKIWDTYDIRMVFTGSMIGLITGLLEPSPYSPLYGRQPAKIQLNLFTREQSTEFLAEGFKEFNMTVPVKEIEETVEVLGGYPGWLAYYGNMRCVRRLQHREALEQVYHEGKQILLQELQKFLETRKTPEKYTKLLKLLPARWGELKNALAVNSKVLDDMLENLERVMIIEKKGHTYTIPDPIMKRLVFEF